MAEKFLHLCQYGRFKCAIGRKRGGIESARHAQDCVQVRLGRDAELSRCRPECLNVAACNLTIEREALSASPLQIERQFNVTSR